METISLHFSHSYPCLICSLFSLVHSFLFVFLFFFFFISLIVHWLVIEQSRSLFTWCWLTQWQSKWKHPFLEAQTLFVCTSAIYMIHAKTDYFVHSLLIYILFFCSLLLSIIWFLLLLLFSLSFFLSLFVCF